jgi:peroxiredoxin
MRGTEEPEMLDRRQVAGGTLAAIALGRAGLAAAAPADLGPAVGARAPDLGRPLDHSGKARTLADLSGPKGTVLMFYRSASWCPFCQAQLIEMNGVDEQIAAKGWGLVGVSYDTPAVLAEFVARRGISFAMVSDPQSAAIRRFGLLDPAYAPGHRAHGVPRPIILMVDRGGVVRGKLFEETYQKRPPSALVLQAIDRLG